MSTDLDVGLNDLRVEAFFLCRTLEIINDEFYVMGGGWQTVGFYHFPGMLLPFSIAVRLIVPFTETNQVLEFDVTMEDEDGVNALPGPMRPQITVGRPARLVRGEEQPVQFPLLFENIAIQHAGTYTFILRHEGRVLARTSFTAIPVSPGGQPEPI